MAFGDKKTVLKIFDKKLGLALLLFQLIAFWGVWRWYYLRLSASSDEFYGVLAFFTLIGIVFLNQTLGDIKKGLIFSTCLILIYAITYSFIPPLLRAVIAVTSLSFFISSRCFGKNFHFGIWSLFLLSLPIVASLQFYLGFPIRVIVGEATAFLLKLNGLVVFREGVCLHFGEKLIWIDAPCSGVKMLWSGFFLTAILITIYRFDFLKSIMAFYISFGIILLGNIFRATGLFYLEAEIVKMPAFAHEGIGLVCFIFTCIGIVWALQYFRSSKELLKVNPFQQIDIKLFIIFLLTCILGIAAPLWSKKTEIQVQSIAVDFPKTFGDRKIQELDLTERERYFLKDFPGVVKRFTDGEREIIMRFVTEPTRKLHPSSDCFSAIGYQIKPLPIKIDDQNDRWSCFSARKDGENLKVCERIYTDAGENWTDVSSWYWSALSDTKSNGYWAITVAETTTE